MLENKPQSTEFSVPGKVFILGEYAILAGLPAMVASVGPRFRLSVSPARADAEARATTAAEAEIGANAGAGASTGTGASAGSGAYTASFHPQSPVARLIDWADRMNAILLDFEFDDPYAGQGGFGGSTAQFALAYRALAEVNAWPLEWEKVWKLYRELTAVPDGMAPSGADLVTQWSGGVALFENSEKQVSFRELGSDFDWSRVLVFSAAGQEGRKVATHEHLARMRHSPFLRILADQLAGPLSKGIEAVEKNDLLQLGSAINQYAQILQDVGLEIKATTEDRRAFQKLSAVAGVKGAGAMQADALIVVLKKEVSPGSAQWKEVLRTAQARGLDLVSEGIHFQVGVQ